MLFVIVKIGRDVDVL